LVFERASTSLRSTTPAPLVGAVTSVQCEPLNWSARGVPNASFDPTAQTSLPAVADMPCSLANPPAFVTATAFYEQALAECVPACVPVASPRDLTGCAPAAGAASAAHANAETTAAPAMTCRPLIPHPPRDPRPAFGQNLGPSMNETRSAGRLR
jgi:hypothetical protein